MCYQVMNYIESFLSLYPYTIQTVLGLINLAVVIFIAYIQHRHTKKIQRMELEYLNEQKVIEQQRREEEVRRMAKDFLISHAESERNYMPLCAIASMNDDKKTYNRKLYNDFNKCSDELKKAILKESNVDLPIHYDGNLLAEIIDEATDLVQMHGYNRSLFHDGGKYVSRCISRYCDQIVADVLTFDTDNLITNTFLKLEDRQPFETIYEKLSLGTCDEIYCCVVVTRILQVFLPDRDCVFIEDFEDNPKTMEDFYLETLSHKRGLHKCREGNL